MSRIASFCPECGINVCVDEDGCCAACGATAMGSALDHIAPASEVRELRRRIRLMRNRFALVDWDGGEAREDMRRLLDLRKPLPKGRR
jgi:hypothetical protein